MQDCLDAQAVLRKGRLASSAALLTGLLYDDLGNRLTPSHTNKKGQRYRYYVSQAVLQNEAKKAGSVTRVAAPDIEAAVFSAVRAHLDENETRTDRELVAYIRSITLSRGKLYIEIFSDAAAEKTSPMCGADAPYELIQASDEAVDADRSDRPVYRLSVPWTPRDVHRAKGVRDDGQPGLSDASRDQLLRAIGKARRWLCDIASHKTTFEDIARQEECRERHVRFLAPLAFLSPTIIKAIHDGRAPVQLTISSLARTLPKDWPSQDAQVIR